MDSNNKIVNQINVQYDATTTRTYPLVEMYTAQRAKQLGYKLDTSFMVISETDLSGESFDLTSSVDQYVSILVVPQYYYDSFTVEVLDERGKVVVR